MLFIPITGYYNIRRVGATNIMGFFFLFAEAFIPSNGHGHSKMKLLMKFLLLALGVCVLARDPDLPVCIVGAGPAGVSAAAELELKGYRTVTFEKQSAVGGKCQAIYEK